MTITRPDLPSMPQVRPLRGEWIVRSGLRHYILGGADPALVGEIEDDPERVLIFCLVEGILRGGAAFEIGAASIYDLLLCCIEVVDPHAEMIEADLFVPLLLKQRDIDHAIGEIDAAAGG